MGVGAGGEVTSREGTAPLDPDMPPRGTVQKQEQVGRPGCCPAKQTGGDLALRGLPWSPCAQPKDTWACGDEGALPSGGRGLEGTGPRRDTRSSTWPQLPPWVFRGPGDFLSSPSHGLLTSPCKLCEL